MNYQTKDSGERVNYESGFTRDVITGKPRYDLIPHELLKRLAELYARGAEKYGEENYKLAKSDEEIKRFKQSALRHMYQWVAGEEDEDHALATVWNIFSYEWHTKHKLTKLETLKDLREKEVTFKAFDTTLQKDVQISFLQQKRGRGRPKKLKN